MDGLASNHPAIAAMPSASPPRSVFSFNLTTSKWETWLFPVYGWGKGGLREAEWFAQSVTTVTSGNTRSRTQPCWNPSPGTSLCTSQLGFLGRCHLQGVSLDQRNPGKMKHWSWIKGEPRPRLGPSSNVPVTVQLLILSAVPLCGHCLSWPSPQPSCPHPHPLRH